MNPLYAQKSNPNSIVYTITGGLLCIASAILVYTNPSSQRYEEFATEELVNYAKENICIANSNSLEEAIKSQVCSLMVDTGRNKIPLVIGETTEKRNYVLFSLYETDLYLYQFQTIGIFNEFYVIDAYQAELQ